MITTAMQYLLQNRSKNCTAKAIVTAYKETFALLALHGFHPKLQHLDNEAAAPLRDYLIENKVDFQLVPPHVHQHNAADWAIRTYKNHFVTILCGANPEYPLALWC
jgi:hypothetical protein